MWSGTRRRRLGSDLTRQRAQGWCVSTNRLPPAVHAPVAGIATKREMEFRVSTGQAPLLLGGRQRVGVEDILHELA